MFAKGSRYETVPDDVYVDAAGREIPYKRLRTIPDAPAFQTYTLARGDRLDLVAGRLYQDPEQFWRLCDANRALQPEEIEEVGRRLAVPLAVR
jgi:hypothetical protein